MTVNNIECHHSTAIPTTDISELHSSEYGDKQALTSGKVNGDSQVTDECETVEEASTSSDSNHNKNNSDSGWNKVHSHIQQLSNTILKNIPSKFHSRTSSEEDSNDNSSSSGFSSAQHSPEGSSNLTAYENFLIVDDNFDEVRASPSIERRREVVQNRCTGILKLNDDINEEIAQGTQRQQPNTSIDSQINAHSAVNNSKRQQQNTNLSLSSPPTCSFWDRMRVLTSAVTLRQPPFQPFTPSPSGSLLPNQSPPNATSIAALRKQQIQNLKNQNRHRKPQHEATSYDDWNAHRKRTIKRYVYISQVALIVIIALVWLASNFVDLRKSPNPLLHPLSSNDSNANLNITAAASNVTTNNNRQQRLNAQPTNLNLSIHTDLSNTKLTQQKSTNTTDLYNSHKKLKYNPSTTQSSSKHHKLSSSNFMPINSINPQGHSSITVNHQEVNDNRIDDDTNHWHFDIQRYHNNNNNNNNNSDSVKNNNNDNNEDDDNNKFRKQLQSDETLELASSRDDDSDKHKIRKRWKNFLRSQHSL